MSEILKPFEGGVKIKWTCRLGLRGSLQLNRPQGMGNQEFENYLQTSQKDCSDCGFEKRHLCTKLNIQGRALVETFNGAEIEVELERRKAPCVDVEPTVFRR